MHLVAIDIGIMQGLLFSVMTSERKKLGACESRGSGEKGSTVRTSNQTHHTTNIQLFNAGSREVVGGGGGGQPSNLREGRKLPPL